MACIFIEGFDAYGPASTNGTALATLMAGNWTTIATQSTIVAPLSTRGQAYAFAGAATGIAKTLPASYSRLIGGCRFSMTLISAAGAGVTFTDAGTSQCTITVNGTAGTISLRNGTATGTALSTSAGSIASASVHYLEWDISFGNTANYQVWLDGVSLFSGTGDTTTTANNTASGLSLLGNAGSSNVLTIDDLYLFDSTGSANNAVLLTSPRIETSFPASDSAVQFGLGAGILGSNVARSTTTNGVSAGSLYLRPFTPAVACTLNSVGVMCNATNASVQLRGVVYADSSGAAGTLLSTGATQTGVTAATAKTLPLTTPQALSAGVQYWLGFMNDISTATILAQLDSTGAGYRAAATFASGAPSSAPAMTGAQVTLTIWGDLTGISSNNWYMSSVQPPAGASSYVFDATAGHEDLYTMAAMGATPATVHVVAVKAYCARSDSGARTVSMRISSAGTDSGGSATGQTPATSYGWLASLFPLDPFTNAAWLPTNLNSAPAGFKIDT